MMRLIIGDKNYSTWSMRPWLLLTAFAVSFEETTESLADESTLTARLRRHSPAARVPVLQDGDITIWDSLAICEYVSERHLEGRGWPKAPAARARARSLTAEMHSGFAALRAELPMNIRARRRVAVSPAAQADIRRVDEIWSEAEGDWLCGEFSIADCFYAPIALRFQTYVGVDLSIAAARYCQKLANADSVMQWRRRAAAETSIVVKDEAGEEAGENRP